MLSRLLFYSLDRAIRQYRKMAQAAIDQAEVSITVDQWLVLQAIKEQADLTQVELAERIFKDQASVARMIRLLIKNGLLNSSALPGDARRQRLRVSKAGEATLAAVEPIILNNRQQALQGLAPTDVTQLHQSLDRIFSNCLSTPPSF